MTQVRAGLPGGHQRTLRRRDSDGTAAPEPKYKQLTLVKETGIMIYTVTFNPAIDYVVRLDREVGRRRQ